MNNTGFAWGIGLLILVLIIVGGYFVWQSGSPSSGTATSTPTSAAGSNSGTPSTGNGGGTGHQVGKPVIQTSPDAIVSSSGALVNATITPNGSQTTYWYEYGKTSSLGSSLPPQIIGSGYVAIAAPAFIGTLVPNTTYYFRAVASNASGTVSGATYSFTTNSSPPPQGTAPTIQTSSATGLTRTTANLNGQVNPNNSNTSYWFEFGTNGDLGDATALQSAGKGTVAQNISVSLSSLIPSTKYYFRLNAQNQFGTVNGSTLTFTTPGPAAPTSPTANTRAATSIATSSAVFNGTVNPKGASTTYWFEYGTDSLLGSVLGSTTHSSVAGSGTSDVSVSAKQTGLSRNTRYYVRVVASNSEGTTRGDIVNFKTNQ